jgi:hypothetical protein
VAPPRRSIEREPRDFHEANGNDQDPRHGPALGSAAAWLQAAVIFQGISGLLCCCGPSLDGDGSGLVFTVPVTLVLKYLPLLFAAMASSRIPARRNLALCRAGAILLIWTSLWGLLEVLIGVTIALVEQRQRYSPGTLLTLLFALVGVPGILCGFIASVKALTVLARPAVSRSFR